MILTQMLMPKDEFVTFRDHLTLNYYFRWTVTTFDWLIDIFFHLLFPKHSVLDVLFLIKYVLN